MDTMDIIWLVVAIVVVIALALAVVALLRHRRDRNDDHRRAQSDELRHEAVSHTDDVRSAQARALAAQAEAKAAHEEAERTHRQAVLADQEAAAVQARQEDVVREADRIDPRVDHQADDYRPTTDPHALKDPHGANATGSGTTEVER